VLDRAFPETLLLAHEQLPRLRRERERWVVKFAGFDGTPRIRSNMAVRIEDERSEVIPAEPARLPSSTVAVDVESPPWGVAAKSIVAVLVLALAALVFWRFQDLLRPIVVAAIIAYLLNPIVVWLMRQTTISRGAAVVIVYLTLLVVLLVTLGVAGYVAFEQLIRLTNLLPDSMSEFVALAQRQLDTVLARISPLVGYDLRGLAQYIDLRESAQQAISLLQTTLRRGGTLAATVAQTTITTVTTGLFVFFISLYIAKDTPQFVQSISDAAHQSGYRRDADRLMRAFLRVWDAYLRGQVVLGLVIGVAVSLSLGALGVQNALGLGLLSGLLEFLPVIGPLVGTAAAVLVAFFQPSNYLGLDSLYFALVVLGVMILIQQVENNLLVPRIVGEALDLHPLVVMIGVIMGASLAGILGAILAAPVVASLKLFGVYTWRKMLDLTPFPEAEPPPKPKRGQLGWGARLRLWRLQLNRLTRRA
jgi:putative heme transporter